MSFRVSNTNVRIQTQRFVATTCIRPNRAITLNRWMLSWKTKVKFLIEKIDRLKPDLKYLVTYPGVHEDKVHLHKGEDHL